MQKVELISDGVDAKEAAGRAGVFKRWFGWGWVGLCVLGYGFCVQILVKVFGYGSNYDDGFHGQLHNFQRGIGYAAVVLLAVFLVVVTACLWAWLDKRVWGVLLIAGLSMLGMAQRIEDVNFGKSAPEFLRGFGDRVKSEKIDFAAIRAWAAMPKETRPTTVPGQATIQGLCPQAYFRMVMHFEEPDTVVFYWGGTWGMWGIMVCPVGVKTPRPSGPMSIIRRVESGVFVCFGDA